MDPVQLLNAVQTGAVRVSRQASVSVPLTGTVVAAIDRGRIELVLQNLGPDVVHIAYNRRATTSDPYLDVGVTYRAHYTDTGDGASVFDEVHALVLTTASTLAVVERSVV